MPLDMVSEQIDFNVEVNEFWWKLSFFILANVNQVQSLIDRGVQMTNPLHYAIIVEGDFGSTYELFGIN